MKKLLCFDLYGTTVDTLHDLVEALNVGLEKNGCPRMPEAEASRLIGHSVSYMCYNATPEAVREAKWEAVFNACNEYYMDHMCDTSHPYENLPDAIKTLKAEGYTLAIVSNKPHQFAPLMIERLYPRDTFALVMGMQERFKKKPDPEPLDYAIATLGFTRADTIYIGDSEVDIEFARNTGVPVISCAWGLRSKEELAALKPDILIESPKELVDAVHRF